MATPTKRPGSGSNPSIRACPQADYLIVDDYGLIGECEQAVEDYRREHGITEPIEQIDWNGVRWRREDVPADASGANSEPGRARGQAACRDGTGADPHPHRS